MKTFSQYIVIVILSVLQTKVYAQCPGGASWINTPVNGTLKDSGIIQVLDTVRVSSTNPTAGSYATGPNRPIYTSSSLTWAGYPYESITVIRGGGVGASTSFKLKTAVDSNIMHFRISDVRGDGFNAETQRIFGYNNGVLVSATANDANNGATFTGGNQINGGSSTSGAVQSSIRIFFNAPVDSVIMRGTSFNDYVVIELAARCDFILPVYKIDLNAKTISNGIQLNWKITGEAEKFEIERSEDKNTWSLLNSSSGNVTLFNDMSPLAGTNYYRIKAIGSSGNSRYSDVVTAIHKLEKNTALLIYPNPFVDVINCKSGEKIISYKICSTTGNTILSKNLKGLTNFTEKLPSSLSKGLYYITLFFQNGEQRTYKLVKEI